MAGIAHPGSVAAQGDRASDPPVDPSVEKKQHWASLSVGRDLDGMRTPVARRQPAVYDQARSLTVSNRLLPSGVAPSACLGTITEEFLGRVRDSTVALVTAVDVTTWNTISVALSTEEADQTRTDVVRYEVLHVSTAA